MSNSTFITLLTAKSVSLIQSVTKLFPHFGELPLVVTIYKKQKFRRTDSRWDFDTTADLVGFEQSTDERFVQHRVQLLPRVVVNDVEAMPDVGREELWEQQHLLVGQERLPWKGKVCEGSQSSRWL